MTKKTLEEVSKILVDNPDFCNSVEKDIEAIKKDGKVDFQDVPELVHLLVTCYNNSKNFTVTRAELPELLTLIARLIAEKYELVSEDQLEQYEKVVTGAIKLVLLVPRVKKCSNCILSRFGRC